jgi:hypothetical protein
MVVHVRPQGAVALPRLQGKRAIELQTPRHSHEAGAL